MSDTPSVATGLSVQRALNQDSELGYRLKGASVSGEHRAKTLCWALPDHERTGSWRNELKGETRFHVVLAACSLIVATCLAAWIVVLYTKLNSAHQSQTEGLKSIAAENRKDGAILPPCDDGWIWHQNKCYHFSEAQGNWTEAKDWCAALDSSLAVIDTQKELVQGRRFCRMCLPKSWHSQKFGMLQQTTVDLLQNLHI